MNAKVESGSSGADTVKLGIAILLLALAVVGFYWFEGHSLLLRVIGLLVAAGLAVFVALMSEPGRRVWSFAVASRAELRKVVWPSRQETVQTTLVVFVMVFLIALVMWLFDSLLAATLRMLIG